MSKYHRGKYRLLNQVWVDSWSLGETKSTSQRSSVPFAIEGPCLSDICRIDSLAIRHTTVISADTGDGRQIVDLRPLPFSHLLRPGIKSIHIRARLGTSTADTVACKQRNLSAFNNCTFVIAILVPDVAQIGSLAAIWICGIAHSDLGMVDDTAARVLLFSRDLGTGTRKS